MAEKDSKAPETPAPFKPYGKGSLSADEPQVSPDGHVHLSAEDIKERDSADS